jgi:RNA polymerase-binding transcription factor DksA
MAVLFVPEAVRRSLEAKRREVAAALASHDGIKVIRAPDDIDDITLAVDREIATADLERRSILFRQITNALGRLSAGEYGLCVRCGAKISAARLRSVPWTPNCLGCQEADERERRSAASTFCRDEIG